MIELLVFAVITILLLFGGVVFFGAPYLPTLQPQIKTGLDLLDLKPGETMLEIGSGDGRVLNAAADRGWRAVGFELNPVLVLWSRWRARRYNGLVEVRWVNAWRVDWPEVEGVYVFGLDRLMPRVYTNIVQSQSKKVKLVSVAFQIPKEKPVQQRNGIFLYLIRPRN